MVTPYQSQALSGPQVTNHVVQNNCIFAVPDHVTIILSPTALHHVTNALHPTRATPVFCG